MDIYRAHVLVCGGTGCSSSGSATLIELFDQKLEEYGLSKAARPFNSRLDRSKLVREGFTPLPVWQDALTRYLEVLDIDSL